jgi:poly(3-hydroxybutyrate) depolymerase
VFQVFRLVTTLFVLGFASAQSVAERGSPVATGFLPKTISLDGRDHRYVVYVPPGYTKERDWPLLVFLHGMGECGTDGHKQVEIGLGPAIVKDPERWQFVVVFPQKPDMEQEWVGLEALVMGVIAATEKEYRIHPMQRLLTGLSQGGAGTWALGARHADMFAAIAPVCGYGKPAEVAAALKEMPIWAFHGVDDKTVPVQQSKDLCAAVKAAGPLLTLYENTAHNSWDKAYRESNLAEWLRLFPFDLVLARALTRPEETRHFSLTIESRTASGECQWVSIRSDDRGWTLSTTNARSDPPTSSRTLIPKEAARCLGECVRLLARSGVTDVHWKDDTEIKEYVSLDYSYGFAGSSMLPVAEAVPGHRSDCCCRHDHSQSGGDVAAAALSVPRAVPRAPDRGPAVCSRPR